MKEKLSCKAISGQQYFGVKLFQYIWHENIIYSKTVKLFQDELIFLSSYFRTINKRLSSYMSTVGI